MVGGLLSIDTTGLTQEKPKAFRDSRDKLSDSERKVKLLQARGSALECELSQVPERMQKGAK
jgi:hypothetical protein